MTQVDFYILADEASTARALLACRLTEKAWKQGHRVYINTASHSNSPIWTTCCGPFVPVALFHMRSILRRTVNCPWRLAMRLNRTGSMTCW